MCPVVGGNQHAGRQEVLDPRLIRVGTEVDSIPEPNGTLRKQIQSIELTERTSVEFLNQFFASYTGFLKRVGQYELCNYLEGRVGVSKPVLPCP